MCRVLCAARAALFVIAALLLTAGVASTQVDPAKALIGTWKGELQQRTQKGADPTVVVIIKSVKQENGKTTAEARTGPSEGKTRAMTIDVDTSGAKPSVKWTGGSGVQFDLSLVDEKNLVGTAVLTTSQAGRGSRDRTVRLEKIN